MSSSIFLSFLTRLCAAASLVTAAALATPMGRASDGGGLFEAFASPAPETRPFARWWWNGGRVRAAEIERELDVMQRAGIGGVEINTIQMPAVADPRLLEEQPTVAWLSDEWCELIRFAAEAAARRGLVTDLLVGSGWPLGGRFLPVEQQTQRLQVERQTIAGPATVRFTTDELLRLRSREHVRSRDEVEPARQELAFLRLLPANAVTGEFQPGRELLESAQPGGWEIVVPEGPHVLYVGRREWGFTHVKLGAPGADGPVINHFDQAVVRAYLERMRDRLAPALGGRLGNHLRALFIDSIELDEANWTEDLPPQFRERRGYSLEPYLPYVLESDDAEAASGFAQAVRQARHDFNLTLVELFQERFLGTFVTFCREQGVQSRVQAYGRETHPLHGPMLVDLPEGETWFWPDRGDRRGRLQMDSTAVNKYVSSAAHLRGQGTVSFEAMTNAVVPFRETLADFKHALDLSFLDGLNHPILHGYNYSPPEAGVPGWVRFGSYVSEHNPWWPAFPAFSDYAARIGTVLRHTTAQAQVAVLPPRADEWGRFGRLYQPFPEIRHPWYLYDLPRAIQQAGNGVDFVSEQIVQQAELRGDRLGFGPQAYAVVILAEVETLAPETLRALLRFARAGGRVVGLGALPSRATGAPGAGAAEADRTVGVLAAELLGLGAPRVSVVPPPPYLEPNEGATPPSHRRVGSGHPLPGRSTAAMIPWSRQLLDGIGLKPSIRVDPLSPDLSQVHHATKDLDVFFLANRSREQAVQTTLTIPDVAGEVWKWDPETGQRARISGDARAGLPVRLDPQESLLLVLDRSPSGAAAAADQEVGLVPPAPSPRPWLTVAGDWQVELQTVDAAPARRLRLDHLDDLSRRPETVGFGGVARYAIEFLAPPTTQPLILDLGAVHGLSEVELNGQALGRRWYGLHHYPVGGALQAGRNRLVITVRTQLGNWLRARREDAAAQRWTGWYEPTPAGLAGPVALRQIGTE